MPKLGGGRGSESVQCEHTLHSRVKPLGLYPSPSLAM